MLLTPETPDLDTAYFNLVRSLPKELYDALYQTWVTQVITNAMSTGGVPDGQRDLVDLVVVQVFTGDIPPRSIADYLERWLRLEEKIAFRVAQTLIENLINKQKGYLVKQFGTGYFSPAGDVEIKKPRETTPQLDGNIVNLRGQ